MGAELLQMGEGGGLRGDQAAVEGETKCPPPEEDALPVERPWSSCSF